MQNNACNTRGTLVSLAVGKRVNEQRKATMKLDENPENVGSNPTAPTIFTRETKSPPLCGLHELRPWRLLSAR